MKILIDFDGTCVKHAFPQIGEDIGAVPVLKELALSGHKLILFTMRSDRHIDKRGRNHETTYLSDAVKWFKDNSIPLYGVQKDPEQQYWTTSPKAYGQLIIDDTSLGIPLVHNEGERPYVDWVGVRRMLSERGIFKE